jgi:RNA polymerase sigma-70 factor, ECF subfamily
VSLPGVSAIFDLSAGLDAETAVKSEDSRLVAALREGSEEAYEQLLARFQQPVYTLALRLLNDQAGACDVAQEVFLKVFRNLGGFRNQSSLKTWIYRIAINEAHNARRWFFRHRRREVDWGEDQDGSFGLRDAIPDSGQSPFDVTLDHERRALVQAALERINPMFCEAVVLRDIMDLSYEEIAEVLNLSLGTVKSRILRGRESLREELAERLCPQPSLRLVPKTAE